MNKAAQTLAPGARIVVRDAEWLVRKVDRTSTGGLVLAMVGVSELVRNKEAFFLTEVEPTIEVLDPAIQVLRQTRQRILIADAVGLGKTLEAGVLLSELIRRGRISYAHLGINQLGAVYEALLSYRGFFAETDLYEVKKAGEKHDELETAYFVKAEDLPKYTTEERVYNEEGGSLVMYPRGTFIYRLAGRDREKTASYYTPEVLTRCLVKYALKELLKDKGADEILQLTVCEAAMGSAAFLNEAVNQLAEAYLDRKQRETGELIPHEQYAGEKQKVKMCLADRGGFDLVLGNPPWITVEWNEGGVMGDAEQPRRLGDLRNDFSATQHWNETNSVNDGTIQRETRFPQSVDEWVLSGPHFFVGNPFYKTPRRQCRLNSDCDILDLPDDYLPRTNYVPACDPDEYLRRTPQVPWGEKREVSSLFRFVNREMLSQSGERTLLAGVFPPGVGHVHTCLGSSFHTTLQLLAFYSLSISIPIDFRVKTTGMGHANVSLISQLPMLDEHSPYRTRLHLRALMLTCLTTHYAHLWAEMCTSELEERLLEPRSRSALDITYLEGDSPDKRLCYVDIFNQDRWAKEDPRLDAPLCFPHRL